MWRRITESFFFSNYFLGILAIALSLETCLQLALPLNTPLWYIILFSVVVVYYTYAYTFAVPAAATSNPRTEWYSHHRKWVRFSQSALLLLFASCTLSFLLRYPHAIRNLPWPAWLILLATLSAAVAYYGKLPFLNLRHAGWTKPLTIGLCWAVTVSLMPVMALQAERGPIGIPGVLTGWLFLKNWMFCSANAILFDIKDYADDSNRELKTFVVRYGTRFTILFILLPLIAAGIIAFLLFAAYRDFSAPQTLINLVPFLLTLYLAWSMQKQRPILYYLIVIDGMLLIKALCGITASLILRAS